MIYRILLLFLASVLLIACADKLSAPLEQTKFKLERNLIIQSGYQKIYFQTEGTIRPTDVNQYEPFCSLNTELVSDSRSPIEVEADVFTITRIDNDSPDGKGILSGSGQRQGVIYQTIFSLASEKQSYIYSLNCQRWVVDSRKRYLSISEIEKIIGNVGKFIE